MGFWLENTRIISEVFVGTVCACVCVCAQALTIVHISSAPKMI